MQPFIKNNSYPDLIIPPAHIYCWYCLDCIKVVPDAYGFKTMARSLHICSGFKVSYSLNFINSSWNVTHIDIDFKKYKLFGSTKTGDAELYLLQLDDNNLWVYSYVATLNSFYFLSVSIPELFEKTTRYLMFI